MMINRKIQWTVFVQLLPTLLWGGILFWLSLTANPPQFQGVLGWDKLQHAGAYGLLSVLIAQLLFCLPGEISLKAWWFAILSAVVCGGLVEILQMQMQAGRVAEWGDLLANTLGASFSCLLFRQITLLKSRRNEQPVAYHGLNSLRS